MAENRDYRTMLKRARRRRQGGDYRPYLFAAAGLIILVVLIILIIRAAGGGPSDTEGTEAAATVPEETTVDAEAIRQSEEAERQRLEDYLLYIFEQPKPAAYRRLREWLGPKAEQEAYDYALGYQRWRMFTHMAGMQTVKKAWNGWLKLRGRQ